MCVCCFGLSKIPRFWDTVSSDAKAGTQLASRMEEILPHQKDASSPINGINMEKKKHG